MTAIIIFIAVAVTDIAIKHWDLRTTAGFYSFKAVNPLINEKNWLYEDANGNFMPETACSAIIIWHIIAIAVFVYFVWLDSPDYNPIFAALVYVPSMIQSLAHIDKNRRIIRKYENKAKASGGIL